MDENDYSRFKINLDDDDEDAVSQPPSPAPSADDASRLDKLNRRITIIAVAVPLCMIVLLVFAYMDIRKNVADMQTAGMANFGKLSHDLEKSLSDLSEKSAKLKTMIETETRSFEKKTELFSKKLNENASRIKDLNRSIGALKKSGKSKASQKEFDSRIAAVKKQISTLESGLSALKSQRKDLRSEMRAELDRIQDTVGTTFDVLQKLKTDMVALSENQTDKQTLDDALDKFHEKYRHELEVVVETFENRLAKIEASRPEATTPEMPAVAPPGSGLVEKDL